ncbi:MAG: hybrid sensor histidine kinase/response regulator, partial [Deltaproteobacteria bacterium]|nr:hybrid sensor histidine kinase/response regulator [Deltaproteobacteria bacterium]
MPLSSTEKSDSVTEKTKSTSIANRELLAGMTHEIRTPLNSIVGFADMLIDTNLNDEQHKYAITIKNSSESLLALIDDILDFSKIEAGKMSLENINFDPEVLCHDVCELIRPRIHNKPIKLLCRIDDNVPPKICGDPLRMRQVLLNFLGNAVKFTESGEIKLSLHIEETEDGKEKLILIVRDTGIGISPDKMAYIFEPFQQEKESIARKYGGTGLGLSI